MKLNQNRKLIAYYDTRHLTEFIKYLLSAKWLDSFLKWIIAYAILDHRLYKEIVVAKNQNNEINRRIQRKKIQEFKDNLNQTNFLINSD